MLNLSNINLHLNGQEIYKNLSVTFKNNSRWLWQGPSGVGKSVLAQIICGQKQPTTGEIILDDLLINKPNLDCFYVSQNDDLFFWQTVGDHINFLNSLNNSRPISEKDLEVFELNAALKLYPSALSGGMKKRLQLLRSLSYPRKLVVLDETLAALNEKLRNQILDFLFKIWTADKTIVICISHQKDEQLSAYFPNELSFPII